MLTLVIIARTLVYLLHVRENVVHEFLLCMHYICLCISKRHDMVRQNTRTICIVHFGINLSKWKCTKHSTRRTKTQGHIGKNARAFIHFVACSRVRNKKENKQRTLCISSSRVLCTQLHTNIHTNTKTLARSNFVQGFRV